MIRVLATITFLSVFLSGCSGLAGAALKTAAGAALGGGHSMGANVQAGKTNSQTVGMTTNSDQRVTASGSSSVHQSSDRSSVKADSVQSITINPPTWWSIALAWLLGWRMPTETQIANWIKSQFRKRK